MEGLADLPDYAFVFVMVLARVGCAVMLFPGSGEAEVPATVRVGFALALAVLFVPLALPGFAPMPASAIALVRDMGCEVMTGLWLGWLVRALLQVPAMAGQVIAAAAGLSNVIQPDAETGPQSAAVSHALALAAPVVVMASGLHAIPLHALAGSYALIPPGHLLPAADSATQAIEIATRTVALALQLGGPFVLAGTIWQFALGLLSRLVPQLQIYFAAMPGQIAGGLLLLAALSGGALSVWRETLHGDLLALPGL